MSNRFHNPSGARPTGDTPKSSDRGKGKEPQKDNPKFVAIHKEGTIIKSPKKIGSNFKDKHEVLDIV